METVVGTRKWSEWVVAAGEIDFKNAIASGDCGNTSADRGYGIIAGYEVS